MVTLATGQALAQMAATGGVISPGQQQRIAALKARGAEATLTILPVQTPGMQFTEAELATGSAEVVGRAAEFLETEGLRNVTAGKTVFKSETKTPLERLVQALGVFLKQNPVSSDYALYIEGHGVKGATEDFWAILADKTGAVVWTDCQSAKDESLKSLTGSALDDRMLSDLNKRLAQLFGLTEETRKAAEERNPALSNTRKGKRFMAEGKPQEALEAFRKAQEADPTRDDAWDGQSDALRALKRTAEADAVLDRWAQAQPGNRKPLTIKMMMAAIARRPAEALAAVDKLIELDPANGDYHCGRGNMLRALGKREEAVMAFEKAIAMSRNPVVRNDSWIAMTDLLTQMGRHDEVIAACNKTIESFPAKTSTNDVAVAWFRRGAARAYKGYPDAALADLKKAIELRPADSKRWAGMDPAFKNLRETADYKALTTRISPLDVDMATLADDFSAPERSSTIWNVSSAGKIRLTTAEGRLRFSAKGDKLGRADFDTKTYFAPASFRVAIDFKTGPGDDSNIALAFRNDEPGKAYRCFFVQLERSPDRGLYKAYFEDGRAAYPWPHPNRFQVVNTRQQGEFGDESQKYHKLSLVYDHGARSVSAFVDEILLGEHKIDWITENGFSVNFAVWNDSGTNRTVDVLLDNFLSNLSLPQKAQASSK